MILGMACATFLYASLTGLCGSNRRHECSPRVKAGIQVDRVSVSEDDRPRLAAKQRVNSASSCLLASASAWNRLPPDTHYNEGSTHDPRINSMADRRRAEIEAKRAKLAELRKARADRQKADADRRLSEVRLLHHSTDSCLNMDRPRALQLLAETLMSSSIPSLAPTLGDARTAEQARQDLPPSLAPLRLPKADLSQVYLHSPRLDVSAGRAMLRLTTSASGPRSCSQQLAQRTMS